MCPHNGRVTARSLDVVVRALNAAAVRYLIVGGLAVVAHGFVRFTADVDLVVDLARDNLERALAVLGKLGYRPRVPVAMTDFLDPTARARWQSEKQMTVFSLHSPEHQATEIDLFVEVPFDFEAAYERCVRLDVSPGLPATFVSLDDLLELKRRAGRPADELDIRQLEAIRDGERDE